MFTSYLTRLFSITTKVTCYLTDKTVNSKNDFLYKMCGISKTKRCFVLLTVIVVLCILTMFFYEDEQPFLVCDFIDENNIRTVKDKWEVNDDESAYVFSAYVIPEDFYTDWFSKFR